MWESMKVVRLRVLRQPHSQRMRPFLSTSRQGAGALTAAQRWNMQLTISKELQEKRKPASDSRLRLDGLLVVRLLLLQERWRWGRHFSRRVAEQPVRRNFATQKKRDDSRQGGPIGRRLPIAVVGYSTITNRDPLSVRTNKRIVSFSSLPTSIWKSATDCTSWRLTCVITMPGRRPARAARLSRST